MGDERCAKGLESWSEHDVMDFLIDEGIMELVSTGLINGKQLSEMSLEDCENVVDAREKKKKVGGILFHAIQNAKKGITKRKTDGMKQSAPGASPSIMVVHSEYNGDNDNDNDGFQYHRIEEQLFPEEHGINRDEMDNDESIEVDPENHKFPPLCERPGRLTILTTLIVFGGSLLCCTVLKNDLAKAVDLEPSEFVKQYLRYASIPILMVPFTYAHIWLALYMTFYPIEYVGCLQIPGTNTGLGWQGIVPFKCIEMAKMAVKMMTSKLLKVEEVFNRLDTNDFSKHLKPQIAKQMTRVVNDIAMEEAPRLWKLLPNKVKEQIFKQAAEESPTVISGMLKETQERIDECFDLEGLVVSIMSNDMELSNNLFIQCSDRELAFIRNCGAWLGFVFGIGQMLLSIFFSRYNHWLLPLVGFIAGAITNWIALFMIFHPVEPISLFGGRLVLHGLFLTRQKHVSALYGKVVQSKILTAENLNRALMQGDRSDMTRQIARKHIKKAFEKSVAPLRSGPIRMTLPDSLQEALDRIRDKIAAELSQDMYSVLRHGEEYMEKSFDLERTLRTRMRALPYAEFEGLLHPVFEQDEPKLVVVGGVLGIVFGVMQVYAFGF